MKINPKRNVKFLLPIAILTVLLLLFRSPIRNTSRTYNSSVASKNCKNARNVSEILELDQRDSCVIEYIRRYHLTQPPDHRKSSSGQTAYGDMIYELFNRKANGTFVEVGAYDGIGASNTLGLERIGWTGVLIECNPFSVPQLMKSKRQSWISNACLSTISKPQIVNLTSLKEWSPSAQLWKPLSESEMKSNELDWVKDKTWHTFQLPAFPLYSILKATQSFDHEMDFLSLDVQGIELDVLKNFPFDEFLFKAIIVEVNMFSDEVKQQIITLLERNGYKLWKRMSADYIFTHISLK